VQSSIYTSLILRGKWKWNKLKQRHRQKNPTKTMWERQIKLALFADLKWKWKPQLLLPTCLLIKKQNKKKTSRGHFVLHSTSYITNKTWWGQWKIKQDKSTTGLFASELHNIFPWVKNMTTFQSKDYITQQRHSWNVSKTTRQNKFQAHTHTHTHTHTKSISKMLHSIFTQNICYIKLSEALGKSGFKLICYSD